MIQMSDDDAREGSVKIARVGDETEVRVTTAVQVAHVHSAVEHDALPIDAHHHAALPYLLPGTCKTNDEDAK